MQHQLAGPPYYEIVVGTDRQFATLTYRLDLEKGRDITIRTLRGRKMESTRELHNEIAAALQFPYYYGENWDALEECLNDLSWIPARGYLLCVADASRLLANERKTEFEIFMGILSVACSNWATGEPRVPFHVLFHCIEEDMNAFRDQVGPILGNVITAPIMDPEK